MTDYRDRIAELLLVDGEREVIEAQTSLVFRGNYLNLLDGVPQNKRIMCAILSRICNRFNYTYEAQLELKTNETIGKYMVDFVITLIPDNCKVIIDSFDKEKACGTEKKYKQLESKGYKIITYIPEHTDKYFDRIEKDLENFLDVRFYDNCVWRKFK